MAAHGKTVVHPELLGSDEHAMVFGKKFPSYPFCDVLVVYPTVISSSCALIGFVFVFVLVSLSLQFDVASDTFTIRNHPVYKAGEVLRGAQASWRQAANRFQASKIASSSVYERGSVYWRIEMIYSVDSTAAAAYARKSNSDVTSISNLLRQEALQLVQTFESKVRSLASFQRVCWFSDFRGAPLDNFSAPLLSCAPFSTLLTYFYVGQLQNKSGQLSWLFDGTSGAFQIPFEDVIPLVSSDANYPWFVDRTSTRQDPQSSLLRTQISIGSPLVDSAGNPLSQAELDSATDHFISDLIAIVDNTHFEYIDVSVGGDRVANYYANRMISDDANLVYFIVLILGVAFWVHFHSIVLSIFALCVNLFTYCTALSIHVFTSSSTVSLLTSLSLYAVIIVSTDSMMIFFDTFTQSGIIVTTGRRNLLSVSQRVSFAYRKAGSGITLAAAVTCACLATAAFFKIPAVADFATFFAIAIGVNWFYVMTFFPAAILVHHFHISGRRRNLQKQKELVLARGTRHRNENMQLFFEHHENLQARFSLTTFKEARRFMDAELEHELQARNPTISLWNVLGVSAPIRLPNPFHSKEDGDENPPPPPVDSQLFLDLFQDRNEEAVELGGVQFNDRNLDLTSVIRMGNINCDEILGFDDSRLRFKLLEIGAQSPAQFTAAQLIDIAPLIGVEPQGAKAEARVLSLTRQALFLTYGNGRSLHNPSQAGNRAALAAVQRGRRGDSSTDPPIRNTKFGFSQKLADWWGDRRRRDRRWCCGFIGPRVDETEGDRQVRIMMQRVKHEGYSILERMFFNVWAPALYKFRFVTAVVAVLWTVLAAVFVSSLAVSFNGADLLETVPLQTFATAQSRMAQSGSCDYCSAYFRSLTAFPTPNFTAIDVCARSVLTGQMMFAYIDDCGVCLGHNSCVDCAGVAYGTHVFDECGQCLMRNDPLFNTCSACSVTGTTMNCSYCHTVKGAAVNRTGSQCAVLCDETTCNLKGGKCNTVTGACDCFTDFEHGFWMDSANASCAICFPGFSGHHCTIECDDPSATPCSCNVTSNRCTGCLTGLVGPTCSTINPASCNPTHGVITAFGCQCASGWDDGTGCHTQSTCTFHGQTYAAALYPPGLSGCVCSGQWRGPQCDLCKCFNGGRCLPNGTCVCIGGWGGIDCQSCASSCAANGYCPTPLPIASYSTRTCRALRCTDDELSTSRAQSADCVACSKVAVFSGTCSNFVTAVACAASNCDWDPFLAVCTPSTVAIDANCRCKGSWIGDACDTCNNVQFPGTHCDSSTGEIVGCDGKASQSGSYSVADSCGVCGGNNQCIGCDGVPGSGKVFDSCGVCGGSGTCEAAPATVTLFSGILSDGSIRPIDFTASTQTLLFHLCSDTLSRSDVDSRSSCLITDFKAFQAAKSRSFPSSNGTLELLEYVLQTGRLSEAGFSSILDPTRLEWVALTFQTATLIPSNMSVTQLQESFDSWQSFINAHSTTGLSVSMYSTAWVALYTANAEIRGVVHVFVIGGLLTTLVCLVTSCSLTITLLCCTTLIVHVVTILSVMRLIGWVLQTSDIAALSLVVGLFAEQLVHMCQGYVEHLHASQSHMFAKETSRLHSVKGMYQRTGVSTLFSGIVVICTSLILLLAETAVFRRFGLAMVVIICSQLICTLIFMGALLLLVGPVESYRTPRTRWIFAAIGTCLAVAIIIPLEILAVI